MKKFLITAISAIAFLSLNGVSVSAQEESIPVKLTAEATPIDVTVSDVVTVEGLANATEITFDDIVITNNSNVGVLKSVNIAVTGINGWTKVASTYDFAKAPFNSKTFAVKYGEIDLVNDYVMNLEVNPNSTKFIELKGYTGGVTSSVTSQEIATVVINLEYK